MRPTRRIAIAATVVALTAGAGMSLASQVSGGPPRHVTGTVSHTRLQLRDPLPQLLPAEGEGRRGGGPVSDVDRRDRAGRRHGTGRVCSRRVNSGPAASRATVSARGARSCGASVPAPASMAATATGPTASRAAARRPGADSISRAGSNSSPISCPSSVARAATSTDAWSAPNPARATASVAEVPLPLVAQARLARELDAAGVRAYGCEPLLLPQRQVATGRQADQPDRRRERGASVSVSSQPRPASARRPTFMSVWASNTSASTSASGSGAYVASSAAARAFARASSGLLRYAAKLRIASTQDRSVGSSTSASASSATASAAGSSATASRCARAVRRTTRSAALAALAGEGRVDHRGGLAQQPLHQPGRGDAGHEGAVQRQVVSVAQSRAARTFARTDSSCAWLL